MSTLKLVKIISRSGLYSRRKAKDLITSGCVHVDGQPILEPGASIHVQSCIAVEGKKLTYTYNPQEVWRFYKPVGVLVSHHDPRGRPTVFDILPESFRQFKTVGRLDQYTEGLLLLTQDGDLIEKLTHPRYEVTRTYHVRVFGQLDEYLLQELQREEGHFIKDTHYVIHNAQRLELGKRSTAHNHWLSLCLKEGKNREIRHVLHHFKLKISRLIRISFGPFHLGQLKVGHYAPAPAASNILSG